MRLNNAVNTLETNAQTVSTNFGIGDVGMVIEILRSKLYSHPIRTLVQEYACNGRDAMREVKSQDRLIITAPTTFNPEFRVRDFGPGISPERIENVFVLYGASTKRKDNTQTGGFGIGAKSAWSYTDSFTITTFIDGTKREYVAHIGTSQNGSLDFVSESKTDEKNGTEIKIAVNLQDIVKFQKAIQRAVFFWEEKEKPELRCVQVPDLSKQNGDELRIEELLITDKSLDFVESNNGYYGSRGGFFLIVDGVPYPIDDELVNENESLKNFRTKVSHIVNVFCSVQTGFVEVSANREQLSDSKATRTALNLIAKRWTNLLDKYHSDKFQDCKTVMDYLKAQATFEKVFVRSSFSNEVDGYKINDCRVTSDLFDKTKCTEVFGTSNDNLKYSDKTKRVFHIDELQTVYIDDLKSDTSKVERAAVLRGAVKTTGKKNTILVLSNGIHVTKYDNNHKATSTFKAMTDAEWDKLVLDLEIKKLSSVTPDYRAKKTRSVNSSGQKQKGEITVWRNSSGNKKNIDLDNVTLKYVYLKLDDTEKHREFQGVVHLMGYELVRMGDGSIKKIKDDADFMAFDKFVESLKDNKKLKQACIDRQFINSNCYIQQLVRIKKEITNPDIKKMLDKTNVTAQGHYENGIALSPSVITLVSSWDGMKQMEKEIEEFAKLVKTKYAIVTNVNQYASGTDQENENIIWYINNRK